jgi:hypothetical protein
VTAEQLSSDGHVEAVAEAGLAAINDPKVTAEQCSELIEKLLSAGGAAAGATAAVVAAQEQGLQRIHWQVRECVMAFCIYSNCFCGHLCCSWPCMQSDLIMQTASVPTCVSMVLITLLSVLFPCRTKAFHPYCTQISTLRDTPQHLLVLTVAQANSEHSFACESRAWTCFANGNRASSIVQQQQQQLL